VYRVAVAAKAGRQLKKLAKRDQNTYSEVIAGIESLKRWPTISGVKKLTNHPYPYRLRVGRYRVFFEVAEAIRVIEVKEVKKRDETTY
jgi:mRNA interferase RelE/StbE